MSPLPPWYNQTWLGAAVAAFSALLVIRQIRLVTRRNDFDTWRIALELLNKRLPSGTLEGENIFYSIRKRFVEPASEVPKTGVLPLWGSKEYHRSLIARIAIVKSLDPAQREEDMKLVWTVTNALNDVAELFDYKYLDQRKILAKYHVNFIRDLHVLEPYIYYENLFNGKNRWGYRALRLGEISRFYNDMNPIHRRSVYFRRGTNTDMTYGAIYCAPQSRILFLYRLFWFAKRSLIGYPTINERAKRAQNRYFGRLQDETRHLA